MCYIGGYLLGVIIVVSAIMIFVIACAGLMGLGT